MTTETLIRGATVVSMDPEIGELTGDVLIEDDKIVSVEPNISADADVIDATDCIVSPGFVDTRRRTTNKGDLLQLRRRSAHHGVGDSW